MSRLPRWIGLLSVVSLIVGAQASTAIARKPPPAQPGEEAAVEAIRKVGRGGAHASGRIEWVSFGETDVDDPTTANFRGLTNLEKVDFILAKITDDTPANLAGCTNLTQVEFVATPITDVGVAHLASLKKLEYLGLAGTRVTDAGLARLGKLPQLRQLVLDRTAVTDEGLQQLANFPSLTVLSLSNVRNELKDSFVPTIVLTGRPAGGSNGQYWVHRVDPKREVFAVAGPTVTDAGLAALESLELLEYLDLSGATITGDGVRHLSRLKNLSSLKLSGTTVSDDGFGHLAVLENLRSIDLDGTQVTDAGLVQIATLKRLEGLSLNGTNVTDAGLHQLAKLPKLEYLHLDDTAISDVGLAELAKIPTLKSISLNGTKITSAGAEHFHGRKDLVLWAGRTGIGPKGAVEWRLANLGSSLYRDYDTQFESDGRPVAVEDPDAKRVEQESVAALESYLRGDVAAFVVAVDRRPELVDARLRKFEFPKLPGDDRPRHHRYEASSDVTALHIAAYRNDLATARLLLRRGASARATDTDGRSPASFCASPEMVDLLADHDAVMKPRPKSNDTTRGPEMRSVLFDARNVAVAEAMIRHGADVREIRRNKSSALHAALEAGRLDVARYLIERGADINHCDDYDVSVLDSAVAEGDLELIRLLVARGVDLHRVGNEGKGALHIAAYQGRLEVVKLLIELGADVNERRHPSRDEIEEVEELQREWGESVATLPLMIPLTVLQLVEDPELWDSLRRSNLREEAEALCELLVAGSEQTESSRAVPPLLYALGAGRMETARYLISRGARYDFGNTGRGAEFFLEAVEVAPPEAVRFMLDHGAAVHCKRATGAELLINAVRMRSDVEVIRMLLDAGAPFDGTLDDGESSRDNDPWRRARRSSWAGAGLRSTKSKPIRAVGLRCTLRPVSATKKPRSY